MKNERKRVPTERIPRLPPAISDSIRAYVDEEIIFDRTRKTMEQAPFSSAPRDRNGQTIGERHTKGFEGWRRTELNYSGRA